jgi:hypothetical protein
MFSEIDITHRETVLTVIFSKQMQGLLYFYKVIRHPFVFSITSYTKRHSGKKIA